MREMVGCGGVMGAGGLGCDVTALRSVRKIGIGLLGGGYAVIGSREAWPAVLLAIAASDAAMLLFDAELLSVLWVALGGRCTAGGDWTDCGAGCTSAELTLLCTADELEVGAGAGAAMT